MPDFARVDYQALKEAKRQIRRATCEAEAGRADLHSLYKCQSALHEALGVAWEVGAEQSRALGFDGGAT